MKLYNAQRVILNSNVRRVSTQEVANVTTMKYETARRPVYKQIQAALNTQVTTYDV